MAEEKVQPSAAEPPTSSCLLLCEDILLSPTKDKHYLQGIVGKISVPKFPATIGPFAAYVKFSNVYSSQKVDIALCHSSSDKPVFAFQATSPPGSNPLAVHTMIIGIPPLVVKKAGRYIFSASHNGVEIATTPIEIVAPEKKRKKT